MNDTGILDRHLDLAPLRGRRRGLVRCIFHPEDRTPSLSVDVDRGLFNCFACGEQGGIKRFAELVGEARPIRSEILPPESEMDAAWRRIQRINLAQAERAAAWAPWHAAADFVRRTFEAVSQARRWAMVLGPDHGRTWPLLEKAARAETDGMNVEAQLDELLAEGRLPCGQDDRVDFILARAAGRLP